MFSVFKSLFSIPIRIKNFLSIKNTKNIFIKTETKPRSAGPFLKVMNNNLLEEKGERVKYQFVVNNFGSEPAYETKTFTEIYIKGRLEFKSPISASSVILPDLPLEVITDDPEFLVKQCLVNNPDNKYVFNIDYMDNKDNRYSTRKEFYFISGKKELFNRGEKILKL